MSCLAASGHPAALCNHATICSISVLQSYVTVYFIMVDLHGETQFPWRWRGFCCESLVCLLDGFLSNSMCSGWARICSMLELMSELRWKRSICEPSLLKCPNKATRCSQHGSQFRFNINVWSGRRSEILKLDIVMFLWTHKINLKKKKLCQFPMEIMVRVEIFLHTLNAIQTIIKSMCARFRKK